MPSLLRKPKYTLLDWFECHFDKAKEKKKKKQHFPVILNVIVNTNTNGEHHIR